MSNSCSQVVFSSKAYLSIVAETYERIGTETGGILLGKKVDDIWYVLDNLDPGPNSVFRSSYFEYDTPYVNHLANKIARFYKERIELLGLWHRHPGSFDSFSSTDDGTNSKYASQNPHGAISGLVNLDPNFRLTMYYVSMPLHYQRVSLSIDDELIPSNLKERKGIADFVAERPVSTTSFSEPSKRPTVRHALVKKTFTNKESESGIFARSLGRLSGIAQTVISVVKPSPHVSATGAAPSNPNLSESAIGPSQELVLEMLENEMAYLESQIEYGYEIAMTGIDEITISLSYMQAMAEYPKIIKCVLRAPNAENQYALLDGTRYQYQPDMLQAYVNRKVIEAAQ
jgi:hypothetical protein